MGKDIRKILGSCASQHPNFSRNRPESNMPKVLFTFTPSISKISLYLPRDAKRDYFLGASRCILGERFRHTAMTRSFLRGHLRFCRFIRARHRESSGQSKALRVSHVRDLTKVRHKIGQNADERDPPPENSVVCPHILAKGNISRWGFLAKTKGKIFHNIIPPHCSSY